MHAPEEEDDVYSSIPVLVISRDNLFPLNCTYDIFKIIIRYQESDTCKLNMITRFNLLLNKAVWYMD